MACNAHVGQDCTTYKVYLRYTHAPYGYAQIIFKTFFKINYSLTTGSLYINTIVVGLCRLV